jgi:hypothetical protein
MQLDVGLTLDQHGTSAANDSAFFCDLIFCNGLQAKHFPPFCWCACLMGINDVTVLVLNLTVFDCLLCLVYFGNLQSAKVGRISNHNPIFSEKSIGQ